MNENDEKIPWEKPQIFDIPQSADATLACTSGHSPGGCGGGGSGQTDWEY